MSIKYPFEDTIGRCAFVNIQVNKTHIRCTMIYCVADSCSQLVLVIENAVATVLSSNKVVANMWQLLDLSA